MADLSLCEFYVCTADLYSALNDTAVCERVACPCSALTELVSMKIVLGRLSPHCDVHFESEYNWRLPDNLSHPASLFCKDSHLIDWAVFVFV